MAAVVGSAMRIKSGGKRNHPSPAVVDTSRGGGVRVKNTPILGGPPSKKKKKAGNYSDTPHLTKIRPVAAETNFPKVEESSSTEQQEWCAEDLHRLFDGLAAQLPKPDHVKYSTQTEKIDWSKVCFEPHSATECRQKWIDIMAKLRRFRTLSELVIDAKEWAKHPWTTFNNSKSKNKHPDLPKKPLTPYFRYFLEKREKHSQDHPELSMTELAKLLAKKFAALPEKKKQKYKESYERESTIYKAAMDKFRKEHPDLFTEEHRVGNRTSSKPRGPRKPQSAVQLFLSERMAKHTNLDPSHKKEYEEKYRQQWKSQPDCKRVKWIKKAILDEQRYLEEAEEYAQRNPDFKNQPLKSVISKAEKEMKERIEGKPEKPPNSGYSLYSKIMLRELKDFASKEKMAEISRRWKDELTEDDRAEYARQASEAMQRYQEDYATYVSKLPEDERKRLEEEKGKGKKKVIKKTSNDEDAEPKGHNNAKPKKPLSALFFFKQEKFQHYKDANPDKSEQELTRLIAREFGDLAEKKKDKYKKMAEVAKENTTPENGSNGSRKKNSKLFNGEPKKPPQSGYVLFTSELIPKYITVDPKRRMAEISRKWKELPIHEQEKYKKKAVDLMKKYQRDLKKFQNGLSEEELKLYQEMKDSGKKSAPKKPAVALSKKVKVETVIKKESEDEDDNGTDKENNSNESDSESEEDSSDEESGQSGSGSGSESKSGSDSSSNSDSDNTKDGSSDSSSEESGSGDSGSDSDSSSDSDK